MRRNFDIDKLLEIYDFEDWKLLLFRKIMKKMAVFYKNNNIFV